MGAKPPCCPQGLGCYRAIARSQPSIIYSILYWYQNEVFISFHVSEPSILKGEGIYNLNVLQEIEVTDEYLGLDQKVRGCQNKESHDNCTTSHYIDTILEQCGCLPFNIRLSEKVLNK